MKKITYLFLLLVIYSCSNENTDTAVKTNTNPQQLKVDVDTLPPPLDTLLFNKLALNCFYELGKSTGGEFYYKSAAESVHNTIIEVLKDHGANGADIVFLIDKTGSMQNDIDSVRINLNLIVDQIERLKNVRLGVAAYGDKNVDGKDWFGSSPISANYQLTRNFVNKLVVSDGGDYPESVYDGIEKLISETKWRSESKKIILVIGDAPSLEGDLSDNSREDILKLCLKNGIKANLFPILVTPYSAQSFVNDSRYFDKIISRISPNPGSDFFNVLLTKKDDYVVTLLDLTGKVVASEAFNNDEFKLKISEDVPNGNYVLRVMKKRDMTYNAERVIVQH